MFDPRTIASNLTGTEALALFGMMGAGIVAIVLDYVSTVKGLAAGFTEQNSLMRFLFKKIGQPAAAFVSGVVFLGVALPLSTFHFGPDMLFCSIVAAGEFVQYYKNMKLLKSK
jgi:hypothetical protein